MSVKRMSNGSTDDSEAVSHLLNFQQSEKDNHNKSQRYRLRSDTRFSYIVCGWTEEKGQRTRNNVSRFKNRKTKCGGNCWKLRSFSSSTPLQNDDHQEEVEDDDASPSMPLESTLGIYGGVEEVKEQLSIYEKLDLNFWYIGSIKPGKEF